MKRAPGRAERSFPPNPRPTFELGAVLEKQKKYADAEAAFRQALAARPGARAVAQLSGLHAGRARRAADRVGRATSSGRSQLEPDNGSYLDSLGWAYFKDGKLDLAEQNLKRAAAQLVDQLGRAGSLRRRALQAGTLRGRHRRVDPGAAGDGDDLDRGAIDRKIRSARQKLPSEMSRLPRREPLARRLARQLSCGACATQQLPPGPGAPARRCRRGARRRPPPPAARITLHVRRDRASAARPAASGFAAACSPVSPHPRRRSSTPPRRSARRSSSSPRTTARPRCCCHAIGACSSTATRPRCSKP